MWRSHPADRNDFILLQNDNERLAIASKMLPTKILLVSFKLSTRQNEMISQTIFS